MENILRKIVDGIIPELAAAKRDVPETRLREIISGAATERPPFTKALRKPGIRIIAELKKASPSRGAIRENLDVPRLSRELEASGAAALSVLTERNFFMGSLENLRLAARNSNLPILRKDFIFDDYQLLEAKAAGASAVLLIASLFPDAAPLRALADFAHELGLEVLGEAHDEKEIETLVSAEVDCIGVNARDLKTFRTDLSRVERLLKQIPLDIVSVAESAITGRDEVEQLADAGAKAFLIGETLMRAPRPGVVLRELSGSVK